jgi:hypothetical protein
MISRADAVAKYFISEFSTVSDEEYADLIRISVGEHLGMNIRTELKTVTSGALYSYFDEMILYHAAHDFVATRANFTEGATQSQRIDNMSVTRFPSSSKPEEQDYSKTRYGIKYLKRLRPLIRAS